MRTRKLFLSARGRWLFGWIVLFCGCVLLLSSSALAPESGSALPPDHSRLHWYLILFGGAAGLVAGLAFLGGYVVYSRRTLAQSERRTAQQQAELDSIFTASPAGIGLVRDRKVVRGNARFFEITGYPEDELIGMDPRRAYPTEQDYAAIGEKYQEALDEGSARIETRWIRKDQSIVDIVLYLSPLDRNDPDKGFAMAMQDITELKASRLQAMAEKTRAQLYLDVAGVMIVVLDPSGKVTLLNKRGCELLDCTAEQAIGADWFQTFSPASYRDIIRSAFQRIIDGHEKSAAYFESPVLSRSGEEKLIAWHNTVLRDESGKIVGVISSGEDITEARAAEAAMRGSEERLRVALSAAQMGTWRWVAATDQNTRDVSLNAMLGLEAVETTRTINDFFNYVHPEDRAAAKQEFERAIRERDTYLARFRIIRPDGRVRWVLDQGKPFYDFNGQLEYMTGVVVDITEQKEAEHQLQESEAALRRAQHIAKLGNYEFNIESGIITGSNQLRRLFGFTPDEEITFEKLLDRIAPEDRPLLQQATEQAMANGRATLDYRMIAPDGSIHWIHTEGASMLDEYGKPVGTFGISQDITEQKLAEQRLQESEAALRKAQHVAKMGSYEFDIKSEIITASDELRAIFSFASDEEVTLEKVVAKVVPEDRPLFRQSIERAMVEDKVSVEYRIVALDGSIHWLRNQWGRMLDEQDNPVMLFGTSQDITERKAAEQRLLFTQFAVDHAGEAAYWMADDGRFIYVNKAACQSLGYTREELLSLAVYDIDPDFPAEAWPQHWKELKEQQTMRFESHHKKKDGTIFPVEITANFVKYGGREYNCAFARDITRQKADAQKREVLMQQLQNRNDELQSIVFSAAHDLRSPLVNIAGFTGELEKGLAHLVEMLDGASLDADVAEQVDFLLKTDLPESMRFIKFGNQQMDMLLGGLMRLSRVGAAPLRLASLNMNELFDAVVRGFQYQIKTLDIDVSVQENLPSCIGDYSLLAQVFINLLDNAIKYRHTDRKAVIEFAGVPRDDTVEYTITDNGIGIEPEQVEKVFELFHQLDRKSGSDGEGLGLTIVRRILVRLNGSVRIDSTPGQGTTVHVRLPRE